MCFRERSICMSMLIPWAIDMHESMLIPWATDMNEHAGSVIDVHTHSVIDVPLRSMHADSVIDVPVRAFSFRDRSASPEHACYFRDRCASPSMHAGSIIDVQADTLQADGKQAD